MTKYEILRSKETIKVTVEGHALYAKYSKDIVCASISTALTMTINALDNLGYNIEDFKKRDGLISFKVASNDVTLGLIKTLEECLKVLSEDYPDYVNSK